MFHLALSSTRPAICLKSLGFSYDWDRELSTTEPDYYKWTQWIFLQLYKRGLAYQAEVPVNWCPALGTVLANEEVVDGVSERGGHPVIRKPMRQWMLKITAYADRLLEDLDELEWPESIKEMQRNWIGRSEGAELDFTVLDEEGQETDKGITVYTTRPDTLFGATYMVVAPEHHLLSYFVTPEQKQQVEEYKDFASRKSDLERTELQKEKTGVFTGCYAKNPANGDAIPIWVADYVLASYGTGAIMAVPAHDTRDNEFALKYNIPIKYYLRFMDPKNPEALVDKEKEKYWSPVDVYVGGAEHAVLHLLYSRFWHKVLYDIGVVSTKEPFKCVINQGIILGEVQYTAWKDQEGNYVSADTEERLNEHQQVTILEDKVMKSGDHFVLKEDPSIRLIPRAYKMSKSRGNVVNPDDVVLEYGADSLRLYEMFMGPFRDSKTWNTSGIEGVHRFLARTWRLVIGSPLSNGSFKDGTVVTDDEPTLEQLRSLHKCIAKVTEEIESTRFNTGISGMMEFVNAAYKWSNQPRGIIEPFVLLLSPYAPHMAEELWSRLGHSSSLAYENFPKANPGYLKDTTIVLPVQINGKTRGTVEVEEGCSEDDAFALASQDKKLEKYLDGQSIKKRIYVPGKILNVILDKTNVK
ncbi:hypothetical protein F2Q68_00002390, partial [Brassica cretica]